MKHPIHLPSAAEISAGALLFKQHLAREPMYKTAAFLVSHHWGKPKEIADGLGVLLLTWNQAFYRYGPIDFDHLEKCIKKRLSLLKEYRERSILSYSEADEATIAKLFAEVLASLAIKSGTKAGVSSPVAAAKALHLLAPSFFPLWDDKIARGYGLHYSKNPAEKYIRFMRHTQRIAKGLPKRFHAGRSGRSAIKLIDEYNFAKFTKKWL